MDSIEQPVFNSLPQIGQDYDQQVVDTADQAELIEAERKKKRTKNGDSPNAEHSPLHQPDSSTSILCSPQNYGLRVIIVSSIVFSLAVTVALILTIYLAPQEVNGNAAVVAGDARCAKMALKVLEDGGNAVDGAVTAAFCQAVVEPQHSGLGGGGFAIIHDHKFDKTFGYDFRETAPGDLTQNTLNDPNVATSVLSTGVPGMVKGLMEMHSDHGKLPWKDLVRPSIELAQSGFAVSEDLALSLNKMDVKQFGAYDFFFNDDKTGWKSVNDTVKIPGLSATLSTIRNDPLSLYNGRLQSAFYQDIKTINGIITKQDLEGYRVNKPDVLESKIKDLTMLSMPAPSGGPLLALILNMAQKFVKSEKKSNNSMTYHKLIETFKFGFGQYSLLGDPEFEPDVTEETKYLLSDALASELVAKIGNMTNPDPSYYGPSQPSANKGTSHLSVLDSSEVMVSMTLSTGDLFGNKMFLPSTGIFLNNNLAEFSSPATNSANNRNTPKANKRPQSTMCPTIIYNKKHPCDKRMVIGAVHGSSVITGLTQTIINSVLYEKKLKSSLSAPRLHNQLFPNVTHYEDGFPLKFVSELEQMGHIMKLVDEVVSQVTGVAKSNDDISIGIDPRSLSAGDQY